MVNVLNVVVVLEHVDELLHVLDVAGVGQLDIVLGDHLHLCRSEIATFEPKKFGFLLLTAFNFSNAQDHSLCACIP